MAASRTSETLRPRLSHRARNRRYVSAPQEIEEQTYFASGVTAGSLHERSEKHIRGKRLLRMLRRQEALHPWLLGTRRR